MTGYDDETRQARHRIEADRSTLDHADRPCGDDRGPRLVKIATHAATAPGVFPANPCSLDAVEMTGGAVTITVDTTATLYVVVLGSSTPSVGSYHVALPIDGLLVIDG